MIIDRRTMLQAAGSTLALTLAPGIGAAQGATFRIAAINPITGAGSPYGSGMQKMILAAVEEVNAAGGAGGRKLEVFADDTQTTPQAAVLAAKKLIEVNKVKAILGTGQPVFVYLEKNNATFPDFHRLDFCFSFYNVYKWGRAKLFLGLYNANNRNNPFYSELVRTNNNTGKYELSNYSLLPLLPTISYSISF